MNNSLACLAYIYMCVCVCMCVHYICAYVYMHYVHNTYVCIYTPHKYMYTNKHADLCKLQQLLAPPGFCPQPAAGHVFHILQHQAPSTYLQTIAQLYYNTYTSITTTTTTATSHTHYTENTTILRVGQPQLVLVVGLSWLLLAKPMLSFGPAP